jgi:hypothetical protein
MKTVDPLRGWQTNGEVSSAKLAKVELFHFSHLPTRQQANTE